LNSPNLSRDKTAAFHPSNVYVPRQSNNALIPGRSSGVVDCHLAPFNQLTRFFSTRHLLKSRFIPLASHIALSFYTRPPQFPNKIPDGEPNDSMANPPLCVIADAVDECKILLSAL